MSNLNNRLDFKNINFGKSDAATEGRQCPDLLRSGYLDDFGAVENALDSEVFLFLGYKGSGKSALMEHIRLVNKEKHDVFVNHELLKQFPYKLFNKVVKGNAEPETKYSWGWETMILLYAIYSFSMDEIWSSQMDNEWCEIVRILKEMNLLPIRSLSDMVKKVSKNTFRFKIPYMEVEKEYAIKEVDSDVLISYCKDMLSQITSSSKHYLIIDGLDEFLSNREQQQHTITALINQAKDLNEWFLENGLNFKVIILCRTDVFDHLSDPNKNKIKQDYSQSLCWFMEHEADDYSKCALVQLANKRARLVYPQLNDL